MNKATMIAVLAASSLLFAEAYQVNSLSAKQLGMGHTGAGLKLGAESMHFNPGGFGFSEEKLDISAGATFISPTIKISGVDTDGKKWEQRNEKGVATPMYVYAGTDALPLINLGVSFTTPYGNSASWYPNWQGAGLIQDISLKVFAVQPTIAFSIFNIIGIGVGPTINFGNFEQSKALIGPGMFPVPGYEDKSVASINLSGSAKTAVGIHTGAMINLFDKIGLGVSYRSGVKAKVQGGDAKVSHILPAPLDAMLPPQITMLDGVKFNAELPLPSNLNIGTSLRINDRLLFAFDWQYVGWGAYDSLRMTFKDIPVAPEVVMDIDQTAKKGYENSSAFRFGTQIGLTEKFDLRAGVYYDQTPVPAEWLNPETPSTDKVGITLGASFSPIDALSIDAAFLFVSGSRSGGKEVGFEADYKALAIAPSIGLNLKF